jgi:hypothetical protein
MNVLVLCTFPAENASHGGQVRLANILEMYRNLGADVALAGVLGGGHYAPSPGFVDFPDVKVLQTYLENPFLMEDWALGQLFAKDTGYFERLAAKIKTKPDIIHVELPWLFAFAERLKAEKGWAQTRLIYGSENIEYKIKYDILCDHLPEVQASQAAELVRVCEIHATEHSDLVIAVSESDVEFSRMHTKASVLLAQNGVESARAEFVDIVEASQIAGQHKYVLFCASAYPPNISGFFSMFEAGFGFLRPNEKFIISGSAGNAIWTDPRFSKLPNIGHLIHAGIVSAGCLRGLLYNAHVIALPITIGGGTNLKTAEALWNGEHIVATSTAMRGYDAFLQGSGVAICNNSESFVRSLQQAMAAPRLTVGASEMEARRAVLWQKTLAEFAAFLKAW